MNRPSRNDDTVDHPTWNQNPPALAADLTTCEDLNGMANARQYRRGNGNGVGGESGLGIMDELPVRETSIPPRGGRSIIPSSGQRSLVGSCPPSKEAVMPVPVVLSAPAPSPLGRRSKAALSWIAWIASVITTAILLNHISIPVSLGFLHSPNAHVLSDPSSILENSMRDHNAASPSMILAANDGPIHMAPPISKRSTCGAGTASADDYNTGWHVAGLAIILTISSLACAFSMIMKKFPFFAIPAGFFFAIRHFGTGVLIATAFVHLLPTAFISLGDPCLSGFWTDDYPAMPGAIALAGIFFVTVIEMVFSPHRHIHQQTTEPAQLRHRRTESMHRQHASNDSAVLESDVDGEAEMEGIVPAPGPRPRPRATSGSGPIRDMGPLRGRSLSISRQLSRVGSRPAVPPTASKSAADAQAVGVDVESANGRPKLTPEQQHKKDILQCMLLEMGILFHSVFIGMTLSVSTGREFFILLIAIAFHQSFEGLALGARIAAIDWPDRTVQPWLMALAYGCTTPIGQAIGLGVHTLYDPNGEFGLVLVGTMNAISSGLLVFASLVELLSEDFLSDESWKILNGRRRIVACLLVLAGAFGMSLVGAWA